MIFLYRSATSQDQSEIQRFQIAMAFESEKLRLDPPTCEKGVRAVLEDPHKGRYFVAESDGKVIGSLMLINEWSDWRNGVVWWIHSVYVTPEYRKKGVFRGLYQYIKKLADPGVRGLRLYVDKGNEPAQRVYEKLGMNSDHYHLFEWLK
jgi:GNAT superfamily N-acetyltransferase